LPPSCVDLNSPGCTLSAGAQACVQVNMLTTAACAGTTAGLLRLSLDAKDNVPTPQDQSLTGQVLKPIIGTMPAPIPGLNFGTIITGQSSPPMILTVTNVGDPTSVLHLSSIISLNPGCVAVAGCPNPPPNCATLSNLAGCDLTGAQGLCVNVTLNGNVGCN